MTIPAHILRSLHADVGTVLSLQVDEGVLTARPVIKAPLQRYSLDELLQGTTPETMAAQQAETEWAHDGAPIGREIA